MASPISALGGVWGGGGKSFQKGSLFKNSMSRKKKKRSFVGRRKAKSARQEMGGRGDSSRSSHRHLRHDKI